MSLKVKLYNIINDGPYSIRYKTGTNPYPEYDNTTYTLYGTGLTDPSVILTGLSFNTQYWVKMIDETTNRYIVKNINTNDSKAFPCYDTICFDTEFDCVTKELRISDFIGTTPCTGYYIYTGLTSNISDANYLNGFATLISPLFTTFTLNLSPSIENIYLFIEHCDGRIQGGYQMSYVDLRCSDCLL
jgi:hypothetical protein